MRDKENPGGSCLWTAFVWGSPAIVVPLTIILLISVWPLAVFLALFFLFWMGKLQAAGFDASPDDAAPHWGKVILYMVAQIVLIPLVLCGIVWGFCSLMGGGSFK